MANNEEGTFEAPETTGRMPVTTWALLYSMHGDQRRACEFPMADPGTQRHQPLHYLCVPLAPFDKCLNGGPCRFRIFTTCHDDH